MDSSEARAADAAIRTLDHELRLIDDAIHLVHGGGAPRVVVSGLRFGEELIGRARERAQQAGLRAVPLWSADEAGADIAIERPDADD
jgi:hypothetical protein